MNYSNNKFHTNVDDNETILFSHPRATFVHIKQNPSNHDQSKELSEVEKHLFRKSQSLHSSILLVNSKTLSTNDIPGFQRQVFFAGCRLKRPVYSSWSRINPNIEANRKQPKLI